ncbi:MAG: SGNH/GDSL hydrolase family protein [Halobacteriota archaeon]|nr:SGNH/GDSL hydrolase family protein [Halobacteriota archaeon]
MPGIEGKSSFIINSAGIRGEDFSVAEDNTYRILTIGGSTTECLYLDQTEAWPYLLGEYLNKTADGRDVKVGNAARSGKNSRHHIMHVKYLLTEYPDIDAIIILVGINDLGLRIRMGDQYDPHFMNSSGAEEEMIDQSFECAVSPEDYSSSPFYERTNIWRFAVTLYRRLSYQEAETIVVQDRAGEWYLKERQKRMNATEILEEPPDLFLALEEYDRNINSIIDLADDRSVRVIFMTQPTLWRSGLTQDEMDLMWFGDDGNGSYYSVQALNTSMERYNERLLETCSYRGIECIDLADQLPQDATVFYDDAHFNENGARLVASNIADYLNTTEPFVS